MIRPDAPVLLEIRDLHASVADQPILMGVNLTIRAGEIHAVMGRNGSGKTNILEALSLLSLGSQAQTDVDAFHFSQRSIAGTARFIGMGGAFGALGGDLSVMSYNPAGLGVYRSSEFSFSPSIYTGDTRADYLGGNTQDGRTVFNFGNAGVVLTRILRESSDNDWISYNFGFGYNRSRPSTAAFTARSTFGDGGYGFSLVLSLTSLASFGCSPGT